VSLIFQLKGFPLRPRIVALLLISVLLMLSAPVAKDASADSGTWQSAQSTTSLMSIFRGDPWISTKQQSVRGDYDLLQLTAAAANMTREFYVIFSTDTDRQLITHTFVKRFRSQVAYTVIQEFKSDFHPMVLTFKASTGIGMTEEIDAWVSDPGQVVVLTTSYPTGHDERASLDLKIRAIFPAQGGPPTQSTAVPTAAAVASCVGYPVWRAKVVKWVQTIAQARAILASGGPPNTQVAPAQVAVSEAAGLLDPLLNELLKTTAPPIASQAETALGQAVSAYDNANLAAGDPPFRALLAEMTRLDTLCRAG